MVFAHVAWAALIFSNQMLLPSGAPLGVQQDRSVESSILRPRRCNARGLCARTAMWSDFWALDAAFDHAQLLVKVGSSRAILGHTPPKLVRFGPTLFKRWPCLVGCGTRRSEVIPRLPPRAFVIEKCSGFCPAPTPNGSNLASTFRASFSRHPPCGAAAFLSMSELGRSRPKFGQRFWPSFAFANLDLHWPNIAVLGFIRPSWVGFWQECSAAGAIGLPLRDFRATYTMSRSDPVAVPRASFYGQGLARIAAATPGSTWPPHVACRSASAELTLN